jgi:uncharacterized membrane protein YcaP (DUF421 family)
LAVVHRLVAILCCRWAALDSLVSGDPRELIRDGQVDRRALRKSLITDRDLADAILQQTGSEETAQVERAVLERDGKIVVVKRSRP